MNGKVYLIRNDVNDLVYVGQTRRSVQERFSHHCNPSNSKTRIGFAISQLGREHFFVETLADGISDSWTLYCVEAHYILSYMCVWPFGYNNTFGGMGQIHKMNAFSDMVEAHAQGKTAAEIARERGVHRNTVLAELQRRGVCTARRVDGTPPEMKHLYESGLSTQQIGALYGWSDGKVYARLKEQGVVFRDKKKPVSDLDIVNLYQAGHTGPQIAVELGVSSWLVYNRLEKMGVVRCMQGKR